MEFNMKKVRVGMIVEGTVFMVTDDSVHLDFGGHAEGVIYKKGLALGDIESCKDIVKEGETIEAKITKIDDENQQVLMSRIDILLNEKRENFAEFTQEAESFKAKVKKVTKGGLVLETNGVECFLPASHVDFARVDLEDFKGQTLEVSLLEQKGRKIVVSRKNVLAKARKEARKEQLESLNVDDVVTGKVVKIMDFGAFVDLGNVQGLIHKSQISHHRTEKVEEELSVGQEVTTKIIKIEKGKIGLSLKALQKTPWDIFASEHKVGEEVSGKIVRKMASGMLVEVAKDVIGMIHRNDYSWDPNTNLAGEVEVGQDITLKILSIDVKKRRMALSKKHLEYNPWKDVTVKVGEEVSGPVVELQSRGALVQIQGVNAFLPIGEIQADRVEDINQVLKVEQVVNAVVTKVDTFQWSMIISMKQLVEGKQRAEFEQYLETENEESGTQTLGDLFKDKLEEFKK
jgi:small subunit ribosomal protein S1